MIATIKARWPQLDVWLTHTDGRATGTADALRFGADGLLTEEGLQRTVIGSAARSIESKSSLGEGPTHLQNHVSQF